MFAALGVVIISGFAFGLGIWTEVREPGAVGFDPGEVFGLFMAMSTVVSGWFLWTLFVWILGIRLFQGDAGFRDALRSLGVCYTPIALSVFYSFVPMLMAVGIIWILFAGVVAIKHTLDFEWWKAGIAGAVGWAWSVGFSLVHAVLVLQRARVTEGGYTMSLNIENEETCQLARELAELTGETVTGAITVALRERLERADVPLRSV